MRQVQTADPVIAEDFYDQVRSAIRDADQARMRLAKLDRSRLWDPGPAHIAADVAALWDRYRVTLTELQLALSPARSSR